MVRTYFFCVVVVIVFALSGCGGKDTTRSGTGSAAAEGADGQQPDGVGTEADAHGASDAAGFQGSELDQPQFKDQLAVRIIYFEYDSTEVKPEYRPIVEAHAAYLADHPNTVVTIEGHADERGSREYNLALGEQRAEALRRQLVLLGASGGQIRTVSYGEERPLETGQGDTSYAVNRRAEIIY